MCWQLLIEEFSPEIIYIKGKHNIAADTLNRLPFIAPIIDLQLFAYFKEELPADLFSLLLVQILLRNKERMLY
jgi:hypothetical protein